MPKCILTQQNSGGGSGAITLQKIEIATAPTKTNYIAGDTFDISGMVVEATYVIGTAPIASTEITGYSVSPTVLTDETTFVTITYSEGGVTCTAVQPVNVTHRLTGIEVTTNPTKTSYEYGDTLETEGMIVTAIYSDNATTTITDYSCSPTVLNTVTDAQAITVSYTENGVTQTTTFNIVVNRKSVIKPTWKSNLTYNGNAQSVSDTSYWDNYDTTYMIINGTTSATNAGTYVAAFTLKDNYRWNDGTVDIINVEWTIRKAEGNLTLSTPTVVIDASNCTEGVPVTLTGNFDGTISITPATITGLLMTISGNTIIITGDGENNVSETIITVSVSEGTNYTAPLSQTFTVSALYWSFGAGEGEEADAAWFAGLKHYLASNKGSTIKTTDGSDIVSKTKTVTLTSPVLGTTSHLIRVIDVDRDADNTVTWQTANTLANLTTLGSSAGWISSTARSLCQDYYNAFPGKSSIKTVEKGTCPSKVEGKNGRATYISETVWLPSESEYGLDSFSSLTYSNSTTSNGECTQGKKFQYSYYSSNDNRIKKQGNGSSTYFYWSRSRYYDDASNMCGVNSNGTASSNYYNNSGGLAPAFVIG